MVDKIITVPATRLKAVIGVGPANILREVDLALLRLLGLTATGVNQALETKG